MNDLAALYSPDPSSRLDNHSANISRGTRAYLATRPNRFKYVHTPKHGPDSTWWS
ncbi:MAG: Hypothetical protein C75L2_00030102 [Leptospirillum sp. Group II 'C75']|uniref:Uncharacterized protein n=1 Tax=Leptospirillum sp. Group II '5-way CG' TaxID=419541 RepID=B6AM35_9BACT|nr:MAG: Hypothetical protein CGL2_11277180 [Leptospirillum sp. Group II '5-way CG']EIJ77104.1 MAG: Hypothetical protein C75L2_00030102 [Leptospirillum sp. Group II 'C75']